MERKIYQDLLKWKNDDARKPLILQGARQVGKTTMLKHLMEGTDRTYVSLDNAMARELAKSDPVMFFQTYKPPILIDEIQKAPELFEQIKIICDESDEKGLIWLTGSQQYSMMKKVRETLARYTGGKTQRLTDSNHRHSTLATAEGTGHIGGDGEHQLAAHIEAQGGQGALLIEAFLVLDGERELTAQEQNTPRVLHPQQEQRQSSKATIDGVI